MSSSQMEDLVFLYFIFIFILFYSLFFSFIIFLFLEYRIRVSDSYESQDMENKEEGSRPKDIIQYGYCYKTSMWTDFG